MTLSKRILPKMASLWPWDSKSRTEDLSEVEKAVIGDTVPVETIEVFCT